MAVTFQLAHCVEEADFATAEELSTERRLWAVHEVETTVDFCPRNPVLSWIVGGLNYQIEHHLFPRVPHTHYANIAKIVQRNAKRHGVRYVDASLVARSAPIALPTPSHDGTKWCPGHARDGLKPSGRASSSSPRMARESHSGKPGLPRAGVSRQPAAHSVRAWTLLTGWFSLLEFME